MLLRHILASMHVFPSFLTRIKPPCAARHHRRSMSTLTFPFLRATVKPKTPAPKRSAEPQTLAPLPENLTAERVLEVERYTDRLFRFRITRPASFRFRAGEFVMIGLRTENRPLLRAYSIASPPWDDTLEFYSIIAPNGPLTSRLCRLARSATPALLRLQRRSAHCAAASQQQTSR